MFINRQVLSEQTRLINERNDVLMKLRSLVGAEHYGMLNAYLDRYLDATERMGTHVLVKHRESYGSSMLALSAYGAVWSAHMATLSVCHDRLDDVGQAEIDLVRKETATYAHALGTVGGCMSGHAYETSLAVADINVAVCKVPKGLIVSAMDLASQWMRIDSEHWQMIGRRAEEPTAWEGELC